MDRNIKEFRNTMPVSAFRAKYGIDISDAQAEKLRVVRHPEAVIKEGPAAGQKRAYFALKTPSGNVLGSVSHKYYSGEITNPVVSETILNTGESYFLLHQEGELPEAETMFE